MSVTTLNYNPAYNSGASFSWSSVTFSSIDGGLTYTGSPTTFSSQVPGASDLTGVTIGNIVTSIGANTFQSCTSLASIVIPDSVLTIGNGAFKICTGLISATIGTGVTSIGSEGFYFCTTLASVTFSPTSSVTSIGSTAFESCYLLASVIIPNSVLTIGTGAFQSCIGLISATIGNSVTSIGTNAFFNCTDLATVYIYDAEAQILNPLWNSPTPNPPGISDFYGAPTLAFLAPPPNITGISPSGGGKNGDTLVTITGAFFTGTTSVTFGVNEATSITVVSDTEITCITPAHAPGSVDVIVTTTEGGSSEPITFTYDITCFKEGSKILTDKGYMLIQDLRKGDLVKTIFSGFKKIEHIGHSKMYHNVNDIRSTDKLYRCSTSDYPELTEDLIITGGHSILINDFKDQEQKEKTKDLLTDNYVTERHYRLPACVDDRTKIFEEQGVHTIWHFSLENTDYLKNYGVYANGLLVESTSNRMMVEKSGLTLLE